MASEDKTLSMEQSKETEEEVVRCYREWLAGKVIGAPKATAYYTVAQLEEMGMVGVYVKEENER